MATFFNSYQILPGETFRRYRLESLALSALLIRKWKKPEDKLVLVTGLKSWCILSDLGLTELYDEIVFPGHIEGVDASRFFALIKLRGLKDIPAPVYSVDWDLFILTQALFDRIHQAPARGLHPECTCGPAYTNPEQYQRYLPVGNYERYPINAGILGFETDSGKARYLGLVFEFMRRYSADPLPDIPAHLTMMFAEQQILGYLRSELNVSVLFELGTSGLFNDGGCYHIWGLKTSLDGDRLSGDLHRNWCRKTMSEQEIALPDFLDSLSAQALP